MSAIEARISLSKRASEAELDELVRELASEISGTIPDATTQIPVLAPGENGRTRGQGVDIGNLIISLAPYLIDKLIDVTKAWLRRRRDSATKITVSVGNDEIVIEADDDEVRVTRQDQRET